MDAMPPPPYPNAAPPPPPPGYNDPHYNYQAPPPNNLVWGILVTLFCCLPFGIVSIINAAKVDSLWRQGQTGEAYRASQNARTWALWGVVAGPILIVVYFVFVAATLGTATGP